ncbi:MAG: Holliday junction resolvase RuvX [Planctomycetes bacterium]|nr:Holliday junction resolvase RuvX [Planctomycetota bacterium]
MKGRALAVDYGAKRTGLAISDEMRIVATPLEAVVSTSLEETVAGVVAVVASMRVTTLVLGMPFLRSGLEGSQCANVRLFLSALRQKLPAGVEGVERDGRFTTHEAELRLRPTGKRRKQLKSHIDSTAAVVLLRDYLAGSEFD